MLRSTLAFGALLTKDLMTLGLLRGEPPSRLRPPSEHRQAAIEWLLRAHDATPDDGISYGYALRGGGWRPSYRETTGYILETFFDLHHAALEPSAWDRATRMARWCIQIQNPDGSVSNPRYSRNQGIVFDTGQVLFGLVRAFEETHAPEFLAAAKQAGDWLVRVADVQGLWTRSTHLAVPHVYNTRTAWALLRLDAACGSAAAPSEASNDSGERERVARANLDWALTQERDGGYEFCSFEPWNPPFTHTIAYALRGLIESGRLLGEDRYVASATRVAKSVRSHVARDGFIPGEIDPLGNPRADYCCLTGNCQLAIVWSKLYRLSGDERFKTAAADAVRYVMRHQDLTTEDPNRRGGIKGSQPVWGRYAPFSYPNWATKFFVEAQLGFSEWLG